MYLVDADVLITAKNRYYGFDIVPAFWDWLAEQHTAGRLFMPQRVADELLDGDDELSDWVKSQPASLRLQVEMADQQHLQQVATWANGTTTYAPAAKAGFLAGGDFFLVALGRSRGFTVVTNEVSAPQAKQRIKIPDACQAVGVTCMSPFAMMRTEGARFRLR